MPRGRTNKTQWEIEALARYRAEIKAIRFVQGLDKSSLEKVKEAIAKRELELIAPAQ